MIVCEKCGHENSDDTKFCDACGEYLYPEQNEEIVVDTINDEQASQIQTKKEQPKPTSKRFRTLKAYVITGIIVFVCTVGYGLYYIRNYDQETLNLLEENQTQSEEIKTLKEKLKKAKKAKEDAIINQKVAEKERDNALDAQEAAEKAQKEAEDELAELKKSSKSKS